MPLKVQLDRLTLTPVRFRGKKLQQNRQTDCRHTDELSKITFLHVSMVVSIPNPVSSQTRFLHDEIFPCDMEVIPVRKNIAGLRVSYDIIKILALRVARLHVNHKIFRSKNIFKRNLIPVIFSRIRFSWGGVIR